MKKFILKYSFAFSITWALIILALCSMPGQHIPSFKLLELLSFDKWVHAGIFFVLCCLMFFTIIQKSDSRKKIYSFFALAVIYGCSLELMQATVFSNRSADLNDIIANSIGCVFGLLYYRKIFTWLGKAH